MAKLVLGAMLFGAVIATLSCKAHSKPLNRSDYIALSEYQNTLNQQAIMNWNMCHDSHLMDSCHSVVVLKKEIEEIDKCFSRITPNCRALIRKAHEEED